MKPILKMTNICKTFNQGTVNENFVLKNLDFQLMPGDYVTIIGGNGAGKSTLLNSIAGTFFVDEGQIVIGQDTVTNLKEHQRATYLGRVFQDPMMGTAASMTIAENLALATKRGKKRGLTKALSAKDYVYFKELLSTLQLGLENRLDAKIGLLSGGQRQAITLLMATIQKPDILLLDEHTAALDPKTAAKVLELTDQIVEKNQLTTLMITHNMRDAIKHGNRLIMMNSGRIVLDIKGEEKKNLTVDILLDLFQKSGSDDMPSDSMILG